MPGIQPEYQLEVNEIGLLVKVGLSLVDSDSLRAVIDDVEAEIVQ